VQFHHGTGDRSVAYTHTQDLERVLREKKRPVEVFLCEKLDHGFLAYTRPFYDAEAARLAWKWAVEFLGQHLKRG
jgi:dienelactone hydrolase